MAIEIYDGPNGPSYVQIDGLLINGKAELRDCSQSQAAAIDKSTYGKMRNFEISPGSSLEREQTGVLRYTARGTSVCAVPEYVKFEHRSSYSLSDLADQARLTGRMQSGGITAVPQFAKGVKLVFVSVQDAELAEFLLAQRISSIPGWLKYFHSYTNTGNTLEAKRQLSSLYCSEGERLLSTYQKSSVGSSPAYGTLKDAQIQADNALTATPGEERATKLMVNIRKEVNDIVDKGQVELDGYKTALKDGKAGYVHLQNAERLSDTVVQFHLPSPKGQVLAEQVMHEKNEFNRALRDAESAVAANQMDKAMEAVSPLRPFSSEEPRIEKVVEDAYSYHLQIGRKFADASAWDDAVRQFTKAVKVKDTREAREALEAASKQLVNTRDNDAANSARERSVQLEAANDILRAFETLYLLPSAQKALVNKDIERLKDKYVAAAAKEADDLTRLHSNLGGLGHEKGIERAYTDLEYAYDLSEQENYSIKMDYLADLLSKYFVTRARAYLAKSSGSGTELGWAYLEEAIKYMPTNQTAHEEETAAANAHAMHSRISLRVQFRDQTSLRDSSGFIGRLEDSIISGLRPLNVKAIRSAEGTGGAEPDFQLAGDVLEHEYTPKATHNTKTSEYLVNSYPEENQDWIVADRKAQSAHDVLTEDHEDFQRAQTANKKKDIATLNAKIDTDKRAFDAAQAYADSISKTVLRPITHEYNYTQTIYDLKNRIELRFSIDNALGEQVGDPVLITKEDPPTQYEVLEGVKSEDTKNVKPLNNEPNKVELQTALENAARDELIEKVKKKVNELPNEIYAQAKINEDRTDVDGAGEGYLRYLHCTKAEDTAERKHAREYLEQKFNMDLSVVVGK